MQIVTLTDQNYDNIIKLMTIDAPAANQLFNENGSVRRVYVE